MLVDPVATRAPRDPLLPPRLASASPRARRSRCSSRRGRRGRRRSSRWPPWRAASGSPASPHDSRYRRVYSSKSATSSPGGSLGAAPRADELAGLGRVLVRVHLVPEHQQQVRPLLGRLLAHPHRERIERVDLAPVLGILVLGERVRRLVRHRDAAGAEDDLQPGSGSIVRIALGGKPSSRSRPAPLAVEAHLVLVRLARLEAADADERVVVALDAEGRGSRARAPRPRRGRRSRPRRSPRSRPRSGAAAPGSDSAPGVPTRSRGIGTRDPRYA